MKPAKEEVGERMFGERPRVLIEDWLPVTELGIESRRERAAASALPPVYFLHLWWSRKPLVASAGVILASIMPTWTQKLADTFADNEELSTQENYHKWFLKLCGILGDPVAANMATKAAIDAGQRVKNPYTYKQAFRNNPHVNDIVLLHSLLRKTWGVLPPVIDPTAGGGSIPFEAVRYGLPTTANDLNPIAASILRSGVEFPAKYGTELVADLEKWGKILTGKITKRLEKFFPSGNNELVATFIYARTVVCPRTGKPVPLVVNWWLSREKGGVAVRVVTERNGKQLAKPEFEMASGKDIDFDPDAGTVKRGVGVSIWDGQTIEGDYIKAEAQAGRMGELLYAVRIRNNKTLAFRAPTQTDLDALAAAEAELARREAGEWARKDILPTEEIPKGQTTAHPLLYGMKRWRDMFSSRQLLVHGTFVEEFQKLIPEIRSAMSDNPERAEAVLTLLGLMTGKGVDYNSKQCSWELSRQKIAHAFAQHAFPFRWGFAEFEGARELYPWCLSQLTDSYKGIAKLVPPTGLDSLESADASRTMPTTSVPTITQGSAANLSKVSDGSQALICVDPPYGDSIMYGELSDYLYVWEKRTLGIINPGFFKEELTDKANEAIVNIARFNDAGKRRKELANSDYESKMTAIFDECHRVLADNGVMSVMFTHKEAAAWDNLGMSLMDAGFTIETSWPVPTESEVSTHQAGKNAAASTIMLVCRKREKRDADTVFLEDIEGEIRNAARDASARFESFGISGVDLMLSTYGPALSVLSRNWPVYSSEPDEYGNSRLLKPEEALDIAREELTRIQRKRLVGRDVQFHPYTDFTILAWDLFGAPGFPYDEARRLALAVGGVDVDDLVKMKVLEKKSGKVRLLSPTERLRKDSEWDKGTLGVYPNATHLPNVAIDGIHTVMYIAEHDGPAAAKAWMDKLGATQDKKFMGALQAMVNAVPRTKTKGQWNFKEAELLDMIAFFCSDISVPEVVEPQEVEDTEQPQLDLGE